jgi:hypothetical protein
VFFYQIELCSKSLVAVFAVVDASEEKTRKVLTSFMDNPGLLLNNNKAGFKKVS